MKDEDIDQRHAAAYHAAGQAVMAFYLGGWVNDEGVEIDERRYCGSCFPFGHDAQAKERFLLLCDLAGWRAVHLWHRKGSSRDGHPDEELFAVLEDRRQGWDDYDGDDADAVDAMIKMSPELWYMNSYSETRGELKEVCAFIAREVSAKIKDDAGGTLAEDLKEVNGVCSERAALGANAIQTSR